MRIYTISELELLSKEEIKDILIKRSELCTSLVKDALVGKEMESNMGYPITEDKKQKFKIKDILYHTPKNIYINDDITIPINIYLDGYFSKTKKDSMHYDYIADHKLRQLLNKHVEEHSGVQWGAPKLQGSDYINMDFLFPNKLINPDIIAYEKYNSYCKRSKKATLQSKEKKKKELQNELDVEVGELKYKRFNLLTETHLYVPEDKDELMALIKKINRETFDEEALIGVVKKHSDNEEVIFEALGGFHEKVFEYASDRLKNDRKFIEHCLDNKRICFMEFVPEKFKDDEELIKKAITISGYIIRVASDRLKNNKELCLAAIECQPDAFLVISKEMQKDIDVINKIISKRGDYFYVSPEVETNKELLIKAFSTAFDKQSYKLLERTSEKLKNDKEIALAAIKCFPDNIYYIGEKLKAEIGNFEPYTYLSKIDLYNEINQEVANSTNSIKRKIKI